MGSPERIRAIIYDVYENQSASGEIPQLERTRIRLLKMGYSKEDTKKLICQCIATEIPPRAAQVLVCAKGAKTL